MLVSSVRDWAKALVWKVKPTNIKNANWHSNFWNHFPLHFRFRNNTFKIFTPFNFLLATGLTKMDTFSNSDPFAAIFLKDNKRPTPTKVATTVSNQMKNKYLLYLSSFIFLGMYYWYPKPTMDFSIADWLLFRDGSRGQSFYADP